MSDDARLRLLQEATHLIVIDGTWDEAKKIYARSPALRALPKVGLEFRNKQKSAFVVRTQPDESGVCTVEAVGLALSIAEDRPEIFQELIKPLHALCRAQLEHGDVVHKDKASKAHSCDAAVSVENSPVRAGKML